MDLSGVVLGWGGGKKALPTYDLSHMSHNDETLHSYTSPMEDQKKFINHMTHSLSSVDISIFYQKLAIFGVSQNAAKNCVLVHFFSFF